MGGPDDVEPGDIEIQLRRTIHDTASKQHHSTQHKKTRTKKHKRKEEPAIDDDDDSQDIDTVMSLLCQWCLTFGNKLDDDANEALVSNLRDVIPQLAIVPTDTNEYLKNWNNDTLEVKVLKIYGAVYYLDEAVWLVVLDVKSGDEDAASRFIKRFIQFPPLAAMSEKIDKYYKGDLSVDDLFKKIERYAISYASGISEMLRDSELSVYVDE